MTIHTLTESEASRVSTRVLLKTCTTKTRRQLTENSPKQLMNVMKAFSSAIIRRWHGFFVPNTIVRKLPPPPPHPSWSPKDSLIKRKMCLSHKTCEGRPSHLNYTGNISNAYTFPGTAKGNPGLRRQSGYCTN